MPPPREPPPESLSTTGAVAAAGAATAAVGAPSLAAPSAAALAAISTAGVITAASAAAIVAQLVDALDSFADMRFDSGAAFIYATIREQYPEVKASEVEQVVSREQEFEQEFRRKMRDRLRSDLPKVIAIPDPAARREGILKILEREKRFTAQREEAMLNRAIARMEHNQLRVSSPEGAYWKLSPHVKEHTLDCIAMGEKFWPWAVLKKISPPLHVGCPCELWGKDEAIEAGLMDRSQIPDEKDAIARAKELTKKVKALQDMFGIEESRAAAEEVLRDEAGVLEEAKPAGHTGAMVALYPKPTLAAKLAVKGGEPRDELHVTLAFLGKAADLKDHERLRKVVEGVAAASPPITGEISGKGLFTAGPDPVTYASVDCPRLPVVRQRLVEALKAAGYPPSEDHGFTPHLTLAYDKVDVEVPNTKLEFGEIALVLGEKKVSFPFGGLEEARRGHRSPTRWKKGLDVGGQFRPQRGGVAHAVRKALGVPVAPSQGRERGSGAWSWVNGLYTHVPEHDAWERKVGAATYTSPAGSTQVYRDGKAIDPVAERRTPARSPGTLAPDAPTEELVASRRADRRKPALERARTAAKARRKSKAPLAVGDGPEALLSLPHAGYEFLTNTPSLHGNGLTFRHGDAKLWVEWDGKTVRRVEWEPSPPPPTIRKAAGRPPRSFGEYARDHLAFADELGKRFGTGVAVPELRVAESHFDHAGQRQWTGEVEVGRAVPKDIDRAAAARAEGRDLTDDELAGVWKSYWVASHEISHGVNPMDAYLYTGANANLEEALAEEVGHLLAQERLASQGQDDVLAWRARNPDHPAVRGNYLLGRHALSVLADEAGVTDPVERRQFLFDLKFRTPPAERVDALAAKLPGKDASAYVSAALAAPEVDVRSGEKRGGALTLRTVLQTDSPGKKQVGWQYGRFAGGALSEDGRTLALANGSLRRIEKLPVPDGLHGTDGSALVVYPPGQTPTEGTTYADGSPKNFRFVDTEDRAKLILKAFTGQGSPGTPEDSPLFDFMAALKPENLKHTYDEFFHKDKGNKKGKKAKPKKPPKPQFIGGVKGAKPSTGPIPSYDAVKLQLGDSAGGSNGARWAFDKKKQRWLVKTYKGDQDRIATELLANAVYREMGAKVAEAGTIEVNGKPALTYPALDGEVKKRVFKNGGPSEQVGEHFMVDALTANWDFVGMEDDNIMWDPDGNPFRVDQGGTFEFRAMGSEKPYGPVPTEVWTMLNKGQGKRGAKVTEDQMRHQALDIAKTLTPKRIDTLIDAVPFKDDKMRERIRENLKARVGWMKGFGAGEIELPKPLEGDEAAASLAATTAKFEPRPEQEDALFGYVEGLDTEIDGHLRSKAPTHEAPKPVQRAITEMDSMFRALPPTSEDVIAYVALDYMPPEGAEAPGSDLVGKSLRERGYLKATLDPEEAAKYATVIRLVIPEGSHALYTPGLGYEDMPPEPEIILARDSTLRIGGLRQGAAEGKVPGKLTFDATVKTEKPFKPFKPKPKSPKKKDDSFEAPSWWDKEPDFAEDDGPDSADPNYKPPQSPGANDERP